MNVWTQFVPTKALFLIETCVSALISVLWGSHRIWRRIFNEWTTIFLERGISLDQIHGDGVQIQLSHKMLLEPEAEFRNVRKLIFPIGSPVYSNKHHATATKSEILPKNLCPESLPLPNSLQLLDLLDRQILPSCDHIYFIMFRSEKSEENWETLTVGERPKVFVLKTFAR